MAYGHAGAKIWAVDEEAAAAKCWLRLKGQLLKAGCMSVRATSDERHVVLQLCTRRLLSDRLGCDTAPVSGLIRVCVWIKLKPMLLASVSSYFHYCLGLRRATERVPFRVCGSRTMRGIRHAKVVLLSFHDDLFEDVWCYFCGFGFSLVVFVCVERRRGARRAVGWRWVGVGQGRASRRGDGRGVSGVVFFLSCHLLRLICLFNSVS